MDNAILGGVFLKSYRYTIKPRSRVLIVVGVLSLFMWAVTLYSLVATTSYSASVDHWLQFIAALLLGIFSFTVARNHTWTVLIPCALLAFSAVMTYTVPHFLIIAQYLLLMILILIHMPQRPAYVIQGLGTGCGVVAFVMTLYTMGERLAYLSERGNATFSYVFPYVMRILGGDVCIILIMTLLLLACKPQKLPGWQDDQDYYDRIWE